jgi:hypothetical protein
MPLSRIAAETLPIGPATMIDQPSSPPIEYPETDGQPMTESDATRSYLIYCVAALRLFFQSRPRIYASGNLFIRPVVKYRSKSLKALP